MARRGANFQGSYSIFSANICVSSFQASNPEIYARLCVFAETIADHAIEPTIMHRWQGRATCVEPKHIWVVSAFTKIRQLAAEMRDLPLVCRHRKSPLNETTVGSIGSNSDYSIPALKLIKGAMRVQRSRFGRTKSMRSTWPANSVRISLIACEIVIAIVTGASSSLRQW